MGRNKAPIVTITDKLVTPAVKEATADFLSAVDLREIQRMLRNFVCFYLAKEGDMFMVLDIQLLYTLFNFLDELEEHAGVDD